MPGITIGQLARAAGVGVETVRFYERKGLLAEPPRLPSGYRQYPQEAAVRVRFIRRAKSLGFSLREVRELLELRVDPRSQRSDVRARARAKIDNIETRISSLREMQTALQKLAGSCRGRGPAAACPILVEMERGPESESV